MESGTASRLALTLAVLAAGLWTLLASSTFDEDEEDTRANVSFAITSSSAAPIAAEDGTVVMEALNVRVAGSYEDDLGDVITLQRSNLTLDTSTGFDATVDAQDPEDGLTGSIDFGTVFDVLLDIDDDPSQGQFSAIIDGTTTLLTVDDDDGGFDIETGGGSTIFRSFSNFEAAVEDEDEDEPDEVRLSAAAYSLIPIMLQLARIGEAVDDDIINNDQTLEGMNLNEALELTCTSGTRFLFWRSDAPGTGEGEVGTGDSFEVRYDSCFITSIGRFVDGTLILEDYTPIDEDDLERSFSAQINVATFFISESEVDLGTNPSVTTRRVNAMFTLTFDEVEVVVVDDDAS